MPRAWKTYIGVFMTVLAALLVFSMFASDTIGDVINRGVDVAVELGQDVRGCSGPEDRPAAIERYEEWFASGECACENADIAEQLFGHNLIQMQECCHRSYCTSRMCDERSICRWLEDDR